jgi:broad specificity phosphatase PhoE
VAERIEAEPRDLVVLRDVAADYWLALTPLSGQVPGQVSDPGIGDLPDGLELAGPEAPDADPDSDESLRRFRKRAKPAAEELAWLTRRGPADRPEADPEMERVVVLYARAVLRHFAGRLMGFEWSGGEHLWRNFLAGTGSVTVTDDGLDVRLPASPLRLVARMAGAHGLTYELPWHSDRPNRPRGLRVTLELPDA